MKSIRVQGLHHKVQRIHFIAVQGHLRQVGHKNQQDTGIGFSKLTGGILEGMNSLIQAAKSRARGYRTNKNFITMIYLLGAKLNFPLPT